MRKIRFFSSLLLVLISVVLLLPTLPAFADSRVYHAPIEENVEKGLYAFLSRAIAEAEAQNAEAIIFEIHTPGGFTDAADQIGKLLDATDLKVIAFINTKAHSAGAYIALHADEIYMTDTATIGSAGVIDQQGNAAAEKAQSAWIAAMKSAAESKGRDPLYAEAMANPAIALPKYRAPVGDYLTLTAAEAKEVGYSKATVNTFNEVLKQAGLADAKVTNVEPTFAENLARLITNPVVVPILLSVASLGLVLELYSPGFGLPGAMGLSALGLFFFGHTVAGFAGYETVIAFVIGLILLIAEFFVPGGIVGIIGGVLIIGSLLFAGESFVYTAYSILIAMFIAVIGMVIIMKFFGKKLHMFNKLVLRDATTTEEGYVSNTNRVELVGKKGETITPLRPAGTIALGTERIDVVSEGSFIEAGKVVEIIKVEGSRIVVREYKVKVEKSYDV